MSLNMDSLDKNIDRDIASDEPQKLMVKKRGRSEEEQRRFILPGDIRRKRIFWILCSAFVALMGAALLLFILLMGLAQPPGFGAGTFSPIANFQHSIHGSADRMLDRPSGIAVSPTGEIYTADTGNSRVAVFSSDGSYLRSIDVLIPAPEVEEHPALGHLDPDQEDSEYLTELDDVLQAFVAPTSLAFADDGRWFAVDQSLQVLLFFDADDRLIRSISFAEEAPIGVDVAMVRDDDSSAVSASDFAEQLFVTTRSGIIAGDLDGNFNLTYMNWGMESGQLDNPTAVVVFDPMLASEEASISTTDTAQLTIVADTLNNRVQAFRNFQTYPELAWMFGTPLVGLEAADADAQEEARFAGNASLPVDLALSPLGRVFILDGLSSQIIVVNAQTGAFEYAISEVGTTDGMLYFPAGICFYQGDVYVADRFNDRLSVFEDAGPAPAAVEEITITEFNRWLLLIPPLLLLLVCIGRLLFLRMPRYVLDVPFLEKLAKDEDLQLFVDGHFNRMVVAPGTELVAEEILPWFDWKVVAPKEHKCDDLLLDNPDLDELGAEAVVIAAASRRRSYLLTASRLTEKAAVAQKVKALRFDEFRAIAYAILDEERAIQEAKGKKEAEKQAAKEERAAERLAVKEARLAEKDALKEASEEEPKKGKTAKKTEELKEETK